MANSAADAGAGKKKTKLRLVRTPGSLKLKLVPVSSPPPPSDHLPNQFTAADSTPTGRPRIVFKFRIPPPQEKEKEKQLSSPQPAMKKRSADDLREEKHGKRQRRIDSGCCDSTEETEEQLLVQLLALSMDKCILLRLELYPTDGFQA